MTHQVNLDVFEGPIDLLLHLITKQRVDIYEVSIATITDEYLQIMTAKRDLDLETATGFLVVAATLLELKSVRLLPVGGDDADVDRTLLEERDLLLARLVECATYRSAGDHLRVDLERGTSYHPRDVALEERYAELLPDITLRLTVTDLLGAAVRVFETKPQPVLDVSHVQPLKASVRDAILAMTALLQGGAPAPFAELCRGVDRKIEVVVRFLGLLELFKAGAVELSQHERFGDIEAVWTGEVDLADILSDVEEYAVRVEGR